MDRETGRSKCYGFVIFNDPQSAQNATVNAYPSIDGKACNCNLASLKAKPQDGNQRASRGRGNTTPNRGAGRGYNMMGSYGYANPYGYAGYGFPGYGAYQNYGAYTGFPGAYAGDDSTNPYGKRNFQQIGGAGVGIDKRRKLDHQTLQEVPETYPQQLVRLGTPVTNEIIKEKITEFTESGDYISALKYIAEMSAMFEDDPQFDEISAEVLNQARKARAVEATEAGHVEGLVETVKTPVEKITDIIGSHSKTKSPNTTTTTYPNPHYAQFSHLDSNHSAYVTEVAQASAETKPEDESTNQDTNRNTEEMNQVNEETNQDTNTEDKSQQVNEIKEANHQITENLSEKTSNTTNENVTQNDTTEEHSNGETERQGEISPIQNVEETSAV
eukprot:TRINITY_DN10349_c0_g1_i1.p1 TRINITY_DN10349_c0_g1~~TRINITY_DN10349_c0_g1_i1.p1  ORF type:complete len:433 (+),score=84.75 TRINITY_DN10349_c0_g1_i1:141-1301(+)